MKLTKTFFDDIRELIVAARSTVARGVDLVQVHTNFQIGRHIVEQEQRGEGRAAYGKEVIKALAERLTGEFGRGFSASNLAYMRSFYLLYQDRASIFQSVIGKSASRSKVRTVSGETSISQSVIGRFASPTPIPPKAFALSWTHYLFLLGIKNSDERSFYEIESAQQDWTVRELKRQFDSSLYERLALSRDKKGIRKLASDGQIVSDVQDLLKEPLVLEFLGLDEQARYSESDSRIRHHQPDRTVSARDSARAFSSRPVSAASRSTESTTSSISSSTTGCFAATCSLTSSSEDSPTRTSARCRCTSTTSTGK